MTNEWLRLHPSRITDIQEIGRFPSYKAAAEFAARTGLDVCTYKDKAWAKGKPQTIYAGWRVPPQNARHEVKGTDFCKLYRGAEFDRGRRIYPYLEDITMRWKGTVYRVEIFCATQDKAKVLARIKKYLETKKRPGCTDTILFVVSAKYGNDEQKLRQLVDWCEPIWHIAVFTTLERLQRQPKPGEPTHNSDGIPLFGPHARWWEEHHRETDGSVTMQARRIPE